MILKAHRALPAPKIRLFKLWRPVAPVLLEIVHRNTRQRPPAGGEAACSAAKDWPVWLISDHKQVPRTAPTWPTQAWFVYAGTPRAPCGLRRCVTPINPHRPPYPFSRFVSHSGKSYQGWWGVSFGAAGNPCTSIGARTGQPCHPPCARTCLTGLGQKP